MLSLYNLPGNLPGEKIIMVYRRDLFILFKKVLFFIVLILLPTVLAYIVVIFIYPTILYQTLSYSIFLIMVSVYYLFIWVFFFFSFIDYYLDVWIVTNERIINIEQQGFFSRVISEQRLYRIQDVTSEVRGIFPTIFKYGNVHVQTAGTKERFFFRSVSHPDNIRDNLIRLSERSKRIHQEEINSEK